MAKRLLIIEDDAGLNQMLQFHFKDLGFEVTGVHLCRDGLQQLSSSSYDLLLLDQQLPDGTGLELLTKIRELNPDQPVIMMTGQHDLELAIQAIKSGAADFIHKPINTEALQIVVERVLEARRLSREVEALRLPADDAPTDRDLIGRSNAMLQVSKDIALSATGDAAVLISGESGTGKEVVARLIHQHSEKSGPFIAVNCAAIVETLLESELFGHEKGAFTGAVGRKPGKFELAQDGTLFLDEIGELSLPLQAKLLRVLQEQAFERVGGTRLITTNARIIAATHRDIFSEVQAGNFREDLAYRLKVVTIEIPALRDRPEDIPLLVPALLAKIARKTHKPPSQLTDQAMAALQTHHWPGNVRELENLLTQALVRCRGSVITPDLLTLPQKLPAAATKSPEQVEKSLDQVEEKQIRLVLQHTGGHKGKSCEILGISRPALDRKIRKYSITF
ncbi:MAG: sigma-54 dependent transcriptional regulator [Candidatus Sedimenticola sp. (ex Thyasira tokunagai)]